MSSKWNMDHKELITRVNEKVGDQIYWDFMGVSKDLWPEIVDIENVICRRQFSIPVNVYLYGIEVFLYFISWKRQEPWSRAVAEAMMSSCPVIATDTDGGNRMQVVRGNNGFLCSTVEEMEEAIIRLVMDKRLRRSMAYNSYIYSRFFSTEAIISKLINFIL
jgi:glycosyltransferase involved in cell wall biosynthesis